MPSVPMTLLMLGSALVFAGRAHVQIRAGIPPWPWLLMEVVYAMGPAFGWWALTWATQGAAWSAVALGVCWLVAGLICYVVGRVVARAYEARLTSRPPSSEANGEITNPMIKALGVYHAVDRSLDVDALFAHQDQLAQTRRDRVALVQ